MGSLVFMKSVSERKKGGRTLWSVEVGQLLNSVDGCLLLPPWPILHNFIERLNEIRKETSPRLKDMDQARALYSESKKRILRSLHVGRNRGMVVSILRCLCYIRLSQYIPV